MGIIPNTDLTGLIDRRRDPKGWAIVCVQYLDLCAASGAAARAGDVPRAKYIGVQAKALHARLW